jgi:hypothetical protein
MIRLMLSVITVRCFKVLVLPNRYRVLLQIGQIFVRVFRNRVPSSSRQRSGSVMSGNDFLNRSGASGVQSKILEKIKSSGLNENVGFRLKRKLKINKMGLKVVREVLKNIKNSLKLKKKFYNITP